MSFFITFAGETNEDHELLIYQRPNIRTPAENITTFNIPGREMNLVERSGNYEPVKIDVVFNYASASPEKWGAIHRKAVAWLRSSGNLTFSDDPEAFWKVLYVSIGDNARTNKRLGKFTAIFVCKPGIYFSSGSAFVSVATLANAVTGNTYTLTNDYSQSRPVYRITGNGACVLTVNGSEMSAAVSGGLTIDTELKIAYQGAAVSNTAVTGDYDELVLAAGVNTISITSGFNLEIQTNYRVL